MSTGTKTVKQKPSSNNLFSGTQVKLQFNSSKSRKEAKKKLPSYHEIILVDTSGQQIKTFSTYGKPGQVIKLDICPKIHPAWNKGSKSVDSRLVQVAKFNEKYSKFKFNI